MKKMKLMKKTLGILLSFAILFTTWPVAALAGNAENQVVPISIEGSQGDLVAGMTLEPTVLPSNDISSEPTLEPANVLPAEPTVEPTIDAAVTPNSESTAEITATPLIVPSVAPTAETTAETTAAPTGEPAAEPTAAPTDEPTAEPTAMPTDEPAAEPTAVPIYDPAVEPAAAPTTEPTVEASLNLPTELLVAEGYAIILQDATPVLERASFDSKVLAYLSKDDAVYISERIEINADNPANDWMLCHFDTSQGIQEGFVRAKFIFFASISELEALIQKIKKSNYNASYQGHLLMLLDCEVLSVTVTPTIKPTVEPTPESTVEPNVEPTSELTIEPTIEQTVEPTAELISEPTVEPIAEQNVELTIEPTVTPEPSEIIPTPSAVLLDSFTDLGSLAQLTVPAGTAMEEVAFPPTLQALSAGAVLDIPVIWRRAGEDMTWVDGQTYAFIPVLPQMYVLAEDITLPQVLVTISPADSVSVFIDPIVAAPGDTVTLTAVVTGYTGAAFQWQWAAIPEEKVSDALETIEGASGDEELRQASDEVAVKGWDAAALHWTDEPDATGLTYQFTATKENLNRYWRLVITLPEAGAGRRVSILEACARFLVPGALAEGSEVVITGGYVSLMAASTIGDTQSPVQDDSPRSQIAAENSTSVTVHLGETKTLYYNKQGTHTWVLGGESGTVQILSAAGNSCTFKALRITHSTYDAYIIAKVSYTEYIPGIIDDYGHWGVIPITQLDYLTFYITIIGFTATFDSQGGSNVASQTNLTPGSKATQPTVPTRAGYTFGGWYKDVACTNPWNFATDTVTADVTLWAKWTAITYTLTYTLNGGAVATANPADYTVVSAAITLTNPTRTGYTFAGWSGTGISGTSTTVTISSGSTGDRAYTANWTINYMLTFDSQGGSAVPDQTVPSGSKAAQPTDPTRTGYTFGGWCKEAACTNSWDFYTDTVTANTTLYAMWMPPLSNDYPESPHPYPNNYYGGWQYSADVFASALAVTFSGDTFVELNQDFIHIFAADGTQISGSPFTGNAIAGKTLILFGDSFTVVMESNSSNPGSYYGYRVTNVAICPVVTFDSQSGSAVARQGVLSGSTATQPTAPTRAGYTFAGWYKEAACTNPWNFATDTVTADITLYAKWSINLYAILYTLNGGAVATANPADYTVVSAAITLTNPTRAGYSFAGWSGTGITGTSMSVTIPSGSICDRAYTANWTPIYTVTFNSQGGSSVDIQSVISGARAAQPDDPTKYGYAFSGWYTDAACTNAWSFSSSVTASVTLWAQWVPMVTFDYQRGYGDPSQTVASGGKATQPTAPTFYGYTFGGWYKEAVCANAWNFNTDTVTAPIVLYARWIAQYTGSNYPSVSPTRAAFTQEERGYSYTTPADALAVTFSSDTYLGTGHYGEKAELRIYNADGSKISGSPFTGTELAGRTVITIGRSFFIVLVPVSSRTPSSCRVTNVSVATSDRCAVTFNSQGGGTVPSQTVPRGGRAAHPTYPARENYTFGGWYKEAACTNAWNFTTDAVTAAVTLYAKWTTVTYTLTYTLNDGAVIPDNPIGYTIESPAFTLTNPTRTGYTFAGWTGTGITGTSTNVTIASGGTGNRTYTATWTAITYTLSYTLNGGSASNPATYTIESATFTLTKPTRTGYTFAGWTGTGITSATTSITITSGSAGNRTYTATWTPLTYTLNKSSATISVGGTLTLTVTVLPNDATDKSVTWSSGNTSVAMVDASGNVTGVAPGTAVITATANDGSGIKVTCTVTVAQPVTSITLNKTTETIVVGGTLGLTATVSPSNATDKSVIWSSSNTSVATINSSGTVSGIRAGTATVTATASDGSGVKAACSVTVTQPVTGITLNKSAVTLIAGGVLTLAATIFPSNATNKSITWSSNNTTIATVNANGIVAGVQPGTATITVTASDGSGVKAACTVTVLQPVTSVTLNLSKITIGIDQAVSTVTATVLPVNAANKAIIWASKNSSIASVDSKGKITGVKAGTATITATAADGSGKSASVTVTVVAKGQGVTAIKLDKTAASIYEKNTLTLKATLTPSAAANKTVLWSSSNTSIATVSSKGVVTGVKKGTAVITATSSSGLVAKCTITVAEVPVSSLKMNTTKATILVGGTYQLSAAVSPANAKNKTLTWSSSNTKVAEVSNSGKVTAKGAGTAVITAKSVNGKTASCTITVNPVKVTKVTLTPSKAAITIAKGEALGKKITLKAAISPANATIKKLTWTSSNPKVAAVDPNGVVTSKGYGTATITATATDGSKKKATCTITVSALLVSSMKVTGTATMTVGGKQKLNLLVLPANAKGAMPVWKSSSTKVAKVDSQGNVTALAKGKATITVTATDGSKKTATFKITVK